MSPQTAMSHQGNNKAHTTINGCSCSPSTCDRVSKRSKPAAQPVAHSDPGRGVTVLRHNALAGSTTHQLQTCVARQIALLNCHISRLPAQCPNDPRIPPDHPPCRCPEPPQTQRWYGCSSPGKEPTYSETMDAVRRVKWGIPLTRPRTRFLLRLKLIPMPSQSSSTRSNLCEPTPRQCQGSRKVTTSLRMASITSLHSGNKKSNMSGAPSMIPWSWGAFESKIRRMEPRSSLPMGAKG